MNESTITFVGNLTADPELKFTPTGKPVANVAVACNPRRFDTTSNAWVDTTPVFWACEVWGPLGENAAESLHKGDRVLVSGRVKAYTWTPADGPNAGVEQRRTQVVVDEIGPSLRFAITKVTKAERSNTAGTAAEEPPF
jgi:single-strand DNA-binding protein